MVMERYPSFYGESSRQIPDGNAPQATGKQPCNGLIHNNYWISKLCFRLTKTGRFNGIFRRQTVPQNIAPESQIQPERNCMLQELFIDIFL